MSKAVGPVLASWAALTLAAAHVLGGAATQPRLTAAVLYDRSAADVAGIASLVEASTSDTGGMSLVERQEIDHLLQERKLQQLLAPDAAAGRAEAARLLKADILVFLSAGPGGTLECVVSESGQGVRLGRSAVPAAPSEAAAEKIANFVRGAVPSLDGFC